MKNHSGISLFLLISGLIYSGITANVVGVVISIALAWVYVQSIKLDHEARGFENVEIKELKSTLDILENNLSAMDSHSVETERLIREQLSDITTKLGEVRLATSTVKSKEANMKNKYRF